MKETEKLIQFYTNQIDKLQTENTKLKEHLKRTHQIMTDMNEEITKLKQEKEELEKKMYLIIMELYSENIINANIEEMRNILEKESDKDVS